MVVSAKKHGMVSEVRQSARQIWLAGVGALSIAEEEGGKVVRFAGVESGRLFKALVRMGSAYEAKNRRRLNAVLGSVKAPQGAAPLPRRPNK